jgi:enoyl-CoA hydratase/carnithine racemase
MNHSSDIEIQQCDEILTLRLNRPSKRNALTGLMYQALSHAIDSAAHNPHIAVIVLLGSGGAFSAGNDLSSFTTSDGDLASSPPAKFMKSLIASSKPIIAAVDGVAVGVGTTMLLHCDIVLATPEARFRLPFVDLGIVPEAGCSAILPARLGYPWAAELLLTGRFFSAEEALRFRIVNRLVSAEDIEAQAFIAASSLAAKPRTALMTTRALMRADTDALIKQVDVEFEALGKALASRETQALIGAMLQKSA